MNSENCWEPLRAEALQRSEQSQTRKVEKSEDWAISSRADEKSPEGSTTRARVLKLIIDLYQGGMTVRQIGAQTGIPSRTVTRWISEAGVKMRKRGQSAKHASLDDAEWLADQYITQDKSAEVIAAEQGVTPATVRRMLKRHGIKIRRTNKGRKFPAEMHQAHSDRLKGRFAGDKNPNWRGGKVDPNVRLRASYKSKEWSKAVRQRDGKCVKCGSTKKLHAHHIKPWKGHEELRFDVSNGVTLYAACHQEAHGFKFPRWVMEDAPRVRSTPKG